MKFKGDVIITDPCYFVKDEDWEKSGLRVKEILIL